MFDKRMNMFWLWRGFQESLTIKAQRGQSFRSKFVFIEHLFLQRQVRDWYMVVESVAVDAPLHHNSIVIQACNALESQTRLYFL